MNEINYVLTGLHEYDMIFLNSFVEPDLATRLPRSTFGPTGPRIHTSDDAIAGLSGERGQLGRNQVCAHSYEQNEMSCF